MRVKAFNIQNIDLNIHEYQPRRASMVYKFFDKKSSGANTSGGAVYGAVIL